MFIKMLFFFAVFSCTAWMLLFMGLQTRRETRLRKETEHTLTTGMIVDYTHRQHRGRTTSHYWTPVVEFTADGRKYREDYENRMDPEKYPVGSEIDIFYDVSDPSHYHLRMDPVFTDPGSGAIRISIIWILASAALTVILAVFVGGLRIDFREIGFRLRMLFHRRP